MYQVVENCNSHLSKYGFSFVFYVVDMLDLWWVLLIKSKIFTNFQWMGWGGDCWNVEILMSLIQ